jgi:hypothetical protein
VTAADDALWGQVEGLLKGRAGWRYEPSTTPGAPPSWCLGSGVDFTVSVSVEGGSAIVYLVEADREINVGTMEALRTWVGDNEERFT